VWRAAQEAHLRFSPAEEAFYDVILGETRKAVSELTSHTAERERERALAGTSAGGPGAVQPSVLAKEGTERGPDGSAGPAGGQGEVVVVEEEASLAEQGREGEGGVIDLTDHGGEAGPGPSSAAEASKAARRAAQIKRARESKEAGESEAGRDHGWGPSV
jgi:hypothetical protein